MKIPETFYRILSTLEQAGFEAWLVGGCVRDMLLGLEPHDYDITTSALPEQTAALFKKTVRTGEKYGTVTVIMDGAKAEVTTFRMESGYSDCRRPENVCFTSSIEKDLSRRDFTVNALAYHPERGVFDPFGGRKDLERHLVRAVGDAPERFKEDALRILRAYRFAAQLGFKIEQGTLEAARSSAERIPNISRERIRDETQKLLLSERPHVIFEMLRAGIGCGVFESFDASVDGGRLDFTPCSAAARWAAFFAVCKASEQDAARIMNDLKFDNRTKQQVKSLLNALLLPLPDNREEIKRQARIFTPEIVKTGFEITTALYGTETGSQRAELADILEKREPYCEKMLAVNGHDLEALGIPPGPGHKEIKNRLLDRVVAQPELNEKGKLLEIIRERFL